MTPVTDRLERERSRPLELMSGRTAPAHEGFASLLPRQVHGAILRQLHPLPLAMLPTLEPQLQQSRAPVSRDEPGDRDLVRRLRSGDPAALDAVLRLHWGPVVAYLVRLLG